MSDQGSDPTQAHTVGYRRPPEDTRFRKGQSGNPRGRPRGRRRKVPYDAVLGQPMTIRLDGETLQVTAAEALLLKLVQSVVAGDARIGALVLDALETERDAHRSVGDRISVIIHRIVSAEDPYGAMRLLGMAIKTDPYRPSARMLLEPWLVEAALARLGDRTLSREEQRTVWHATRTPKKVNWPAWWSERGGAVSD